MDDPAWLQQQLQSELAAGGGLGREGRGVAGQGWGAELVAAGV